MNDNAKKDLEKIKQQIGLLITGITKHQDDEKTYMDAFLGEDEVMKSEERIDSLEHAILYLSDVENLIYKAILI